MTRVDLLPPSLVRSRLRRGAAWLSVALALAGCARFNIRSRQDPAYDFARLRTYAWLPIDEAAPADQRTLNRLLDARVKRAVESQLQAKGYRPADGPSDFLLNYRLARQPASDVKGDPRRAFADAFWWGLPDSEGFYTESYDEGTLYVAALDPGTKRIFWVGAAGARLMPTASMEKTEKRVDDAVHQIMERFPGKP